MKRILFIGMILLLCLSLCSCGQTGNSSEQASDTNRIADIIENESAASVEEQPAQPNTSSQTEEPNPDISFPFEDDEGRTRYRLVINGTEVETENYPFTLPDEPKGGYYPIEDVLNCFGVACLTNEDKSACATVINGNVIKAFAGVADMTYGKKIISSFGTDSPVVVDGALYVPSSLLMQLSDNSIVDFSDDRSAATLDTDVVVDVSASGPAGIDESILAQDSSGGSGGVNAGSYRCTTCVGAGGYNEQYFDQIMVNGGWKQVPKSRWIHCPVCGGRGTVN